MSGQVELTLSATPASEIAAAKTRGFQGQDLAAADSLAATAKHFCAYGAVTAGREYASAEVSERTLREIYLPHYQMAVQQAHVGSIMAAYNAVNGEHCTENTHLLHDILKGEWGFEGFVESDWFATRSTVASALAGLDIEMPIPLHYGDSLPTAVGAGDVVQLGERAVGGDARRGEAAARVVALVRDD